MRAQKGFLIVTAIAIVVAPAAPSSATPVTMSSVGNVGQTRVFRGDVSGLGLASVDAVTVTDAGSGGADGVFSGFDLDFLLFDADGVLGTPGDQALPFQTPATAVTPGTVANQGGSLYQPTGAHPGDLFGLNTDDSIDFTTATIGILDGSFADPLAVNTSHGWVTFGFNGSLSAAFPSTAVGPSLWVFVGEVGPSTTEGLHATVDVTGVPIPAPGAILLGAIGTSLVAWLRRRRAL